MHRLALLLLPSHPFRGLAVVLLLVILAGCATRGITEFMLYRDAFAAANTAGQAILDRMAVAERELFQVEKAGESIQNVDFDPNEARYYIETIDPPVTASLRRSFDIVNAYGETLAALASGESAEVIAARVSGMGAVAMEAALPVAGLAGGTEALPSASSLAAQIVNPLKAFEPLMAFAFTHRTRQEFQDRLLADYDSIESALAKMREITPEIFDLMKTNLFLSSRLAGGSIPDPEILDEMKTLRALMANWVILIERCQVALAQTRQAVESTGGSIAGFTTAASELRMTAQAVSRNLANLGQ